MSAVPAARAVFCRRSYHGAGWSYEHSGYTENLAPEIREELVTNGVLQLQRESMRCHAIYVAAEDYQSAIQALNAIDGTFRRKE